MEDIKSFDIIRRTLKEARFMSVNRKKKPRLESRHRQVRLEFAIKHKEWTAEDWK